MNFFFDPYLFAIDLSESSLSEFEEYLDILISWHEFSELDYGKLYMLSSTIDCLITNELYPYTDELKQIINKYKITHICTSDIEKILHKFLNKILRTEDLGLIIVETKSADISPSLPHRPHIFYNELIKLLNIVSHYSLINSINDEKNIIISRNIEGRFECKFLYETIDENCKVENFETQNIYNLFISPNSFFTKSNTPKLIWKYACNKNDLDLGVRIKLFSDNRYSSLRNSFSSHNFTFQESFFYDFTQLHLAFIEAKIIATLRSITDVITGINNSETHGLRNGSGPNNPQITYEEYQAWRKDIDYELHLHYWKSGCSHIFANVVNHRNVSITNEF